jgi:hypothetical protein
MGSWMTLGCRWAHVQRLHVLTCLQVMDLILIMSVLIQCAMCTSFPGTWRAFTAHMQIQSQLKITHADKDLQATCCWFQQKLLLLNYLSAYVSWMQPSWTGIPWCKLTFTSNLVPYSSVDRRLGGGSVQQRRRRRRRWVMSKELLIQLAI